VSKNPIGDELEADLRTTPEKYTKDLHKEMQNLHEEIENQMTIEEDAVKKDEEMLQMLENMMNMFARYETDLTTYVTFIYDNPDADDAVQSMRFMQKVNEGDINLNNNPAELPQVLESMEQDFKEVFEDLREKDEQLKKVLDTDHDMEEQIQIIEKMTEKLEVLTEEYNEARNN
jgi:hypothetical protein